MSQAMTGKMEAYLAARHRAERTDLFVQLAALLAAGGLLICAGLLVGPINQIRKDEQIVVPFDDKSLADLPPDIALLTKIGTLRALAIDIAFIRAEDLKQENRFYELMQLSNWLCDLAPRYAKVWSYAAWNMAYNISVGEYTPEARWMWVSNGIEALRNRGLRYNPRSITLYKELAWTFYHKVGDKLDDFHWQYKCELAVQMELLFGEPPLDLTAAGRVAAIRAIAEAPDDVAEWVRQTPAAAALVARLHEVGLSADETLLHFVARYLRTYSNVGALAADASDPGQSDLLVRRQAVLRRPQDSDTIATLLAALRKQVLGDKFNMDVHWMLKLMEAPGWMEGEKDSTLPLDWRLPFAHSLYWATYGDMKCLGTYNMDQADEMNTVRLIFFSLANLLAGGKVTLEPDFEHPNRSFLQVQPDLSFIRPMHHAYLYFGKKLFGDAPDFVEGTSGPNYASGHRNFLRDAIRLLYLEGGAENVAEAKDYYFYLRRYDRAEDGGVKPQYDVTFDEFVFNEIKESLDTQRGATAFISGLLARSLRNAIDGRIERSVGNFNEANKWWNYYMRDLKTDRNERRKLEPLLVMRRDVARQMLIAAPEEYSALEKHRLWAALDLPTRQSLYDDVLPFVVRHCEVNDPPLDPVKVFPIPPGMEEHRKDPDKVLEGLERYNPDVSQGEKVIVK